MPARVSHLDPAFERELRAVMFDRALPCPHCRYDLSGLTRPVCPECGREVEYYLRVADLSPGRLRSERFERTVRLVIKIMGVALLAVPLIALIVLIILSRQSGW